LKATHNRAALLAYGRQEININEKEKNGNNCTQVFKKNLNQLAQFDPAIMDRIDEMVEFDMPKEVERQLISLPRGLEVGAPESWILPTGRHPFRRRLSISKHHGHPLLSTPRLVHKDPWRQKSVHFATH
jgi:hypothetical protein